VLEQYHDDRTDPEMLRRALNLLHDCDMDLDDMRITALRDLFTLDAEAAETYLIIERKDTRKAWVQDQLKGLGFPGEDMTILVHRLV
jgi:hypothetical protein